MFYSQDGYLLPYEYLEGLDLILKWRRGPNRAFQRPKVSYFIVQSGIIFWKRVLNFISSKKKETLDLRLIVVTTYLYVTRAGLLYETAHKSSLPVTGL